MMISNWAIEELKSRGLSEIWEVIRV